VAAVTAVDVTKIPLGQALARLQAGWKKPWPEIIAAIRSDSPDRISFGNVYGLHYKTLPAARELAVGAAATPQQRGDSAIGGYGFKRTSEWERRAASHSPRAVVTWVCYVEPRYTPAGRRKK
jgi:hypothetical protein